MQSFATSSRHGLGILAWLLVACLPAIELLAQETSEPGAAVDSVESLWTRPRGEDWPRMLGVRYDSRSLESGILTDWGKEGLRLVWHQKTGTGYGNGVAAAGRWFQFDRFADVERLTCSRAETGERLWSWESPVEYSDAYGYNNGPRCSPVVDGDRVYLYGVAGRLTCLSVVDGRERWSRDLSQDYHVVPNFFGVGASPVVYDDRLLVMVGGSPPDQFGGRIPTVNDVPQARPNGSAMVSLDKFTGKEIYRIGDYLASYSAPVIATLGGIDHCVALVREGLLVFQAADGSGAAFFPWRAATLESVNAASPVVIGNRIFISEAYEIGSALLEWNEGRLESVWQDTGGRSNQAMRTHWATPVLHQNFLFASSGRNQPDTDLRCIELSERGSASVKWKFRNRDRGTALLVEDAMLWLGESGLLQLVRLTPEKYDVVTEMELRVPSAGGRSEPIATPCWAPPVLAHGLLYVRGADHVVCLELIPQ